MVKYLVEALSHYSLAKRAVVEAGYGDECRWQVAQLPIALSAPAFVCEAAWVILNSGFRESVARKVFPGLTLAFCDWEPDEIAPRRDRCITAARLAFRNGRKVAAIADVAERCVKERWPAFVATMLLNPALELAKLPMIGPVTAYHLAKNIGFDVAKPDRHLVRLASALGANDPQELCVAIADRTGDPVRLVDLVLWRYAASIATA